MTKKIKDYTISIYKKLHSIPEVGFYLPKTFELIKKEINKLDIKIDYYDDNLCIIGSIIKNNNLEYKLLRADCDGLFIKENTNLEFKSTNLNMHACGHDGHTAMLLGAIKYLSNNKDKLKYNVKFIFQSAEEGPMPGGAFRILELNKLYNIKECFALHIDPNTYYNDILIHSKFSTMNTSEFNLTISMKSLHAALSTKYNNPLYFSSKVLNYIYGYLQKEIEEDYIFNITSAVTDIDTYNVIPNSITLKGTIRCNEYLVIEKIKSLIEKKLLKYRYKYNIKYKLDINYGYLSTINDINLVNKYKDIFYMYNVSISDKSYPFGEDFSYFSRKYPSLLVWLGNKSKEYKEPLHSNKFKINLNTLEIGTNLHILFCLS